MYIYIQNTAVSRVLVRHLCFSPNFQLAGAQIYGLKAPTFVSLSVPFETTLISDRTHYRWKCLVCTTHWRRGAGASLSTFKKLLKTQLFREHLPS